MRAFHFRGTAWAVAWALLSAAEPASGQFPGELLGRVVDAVTGLPVADARIDLAELQRVALSGGSGGFRLRGLEPGSYSLRVRRVGYATLAAEVEIRNGATARVTFYLQPAPVALAPLSVQVRSPEIPSVYRITRREVRSSGARTAGDLVATVPSVIVTEAGLGGAQTVSIRGSSPDAVLVLLDGAPLNDPITGEADLSRVSAAGIEEIQVLPGGGTSSYGPGAEGGVILIRTAEVPTVSSASLGTGSLGLVDAVAEGGREFGKGRLGFGAKASWVGGAFSFTKAPEVGGGRARRSNADVRRISGWGVLSLPGEGSDARFRIGFESIARGLPGKGFDPSRFARQEALRARASATWSGSSRAGRGDVVGYLAVDRTSFRDSDPPAGLPFDTRTRVTTAGVRAKLSRGLASRWIPEVGGRAIVAVQRVSSGALSPAAPRGREDVTLSARAVVTPPVSGLSVALTGAGHWDDLAGRWRATHDAALRWGRPGLSMHLAYRSSFSLPTLGDQFFKEGVAVAPNPELRAERVPSELEVGLEARGSRASLDLAAGFSLYRGDVEDMIIWAPDFRFVWSPRNIDVDRWGMDIWADATSSTGIGVLHGSVSYARTVVTYDRPDPTPVQVLYRPRHSGSAVLEWTTGPWEVRLRSRLTGARFPVASPVNELPAFWTTGLRVARTLDFSGRHVGLAFQVERLLDHDNTLIFGYPHPGRTVTLTVSVRPDPGRRPVEPRE